MFKSSMHLLEDLHDHIKLLHTPERAQVRAQRGLMRLPRRAKLAWAACRAGA
jgi:hypothetical protein